MTTLASDLASETLAKYIDHTILAPQATPAEVETICREALEFGFCSVCVNPINIPQVAKLLAGSDVVTCSVIGFPLGAIPTSLKCAEARWVVAEGADEVDMVIPVGQLKAGDVDYVRNDIAEVKKACGKAKLKVIIETCLLRR